MLSYFRAAVTYAPTSIVPHPASHRPRQGWREKENVLAGSARRGHGSAPEHNQLGLIDSEAGVTQHNERGGFVHTRRLDRRRRYQRLRGGARGRLCGGFGGRRRRVHRLAVLLHPLRPARDLRAQRIEQGARAGRQVRLPARRDEHLIDERVRQPRHGRRLRQVVREARVALCARATIVPEKKQGSATSHARTPPEAEKREKRRGRTYVAHHGERVLERGLEHLVPQTRTDEVLRVVFLGIPTIAPVSVQYRSGRW